MSHTSETEGNLFDFGLKASVFGTSFLLLSASVLTLALFINSFVPEPMEASYTDIITNKFNAKRAYKDLEELASIGPKVTGTYANEVRAVEFLLGKILEIENGTSQYENGIEFDVQRVSHCFHIPDKTTVQCYQNVQNVVVKLQSAARNTSEKILVNCHFDSMPTSPGASDDGLHCAVMLEMIRVLLVDDKPLNKNVIFLFNGAEEDGLMASHGFITQHKWAENIASFINLESCGAGGREILFQTGPNAAILPQIYAKNVPYPYGNVIGEELFQSGLLPSDTDFRIFRDFGKLKGLDFAHYRNGYVYHTSSDNMSFISTNVIQHTGSNILTLLRSLIDESDLKNKIENSKGQAVFFDIMGKFMICYTKDTAFKLNLLVVLVSIVSSTVIILQLYRSIKLISIISHFAINFTFLLVACLAATAVLFMLAQLLKWRELTMLWYANQWFAVIYYGLPAIFVVTSILRIRRSIFKSKLTVEEEIMLFIVALQNIFAFLVFAATILQVRSIYVFVICLVPLCVSQLLNASLFKSSKAEVRLLVYVLLNSGSVFYATYLSVPLFHLLIPMLGRVGTTVDNETIVWIMCEICFLLIFAFFMPLVLLVKNFWKLQLAVAAAFVVFVVVILFASPLDPFSEGAPERFEIMHVNRKVYFGADYEKTELNGFFLIPVDQRAPRSIEKIFTDQHFTSVFSNCSEIFMCGAPISKYSGFGSNFAHSFWSSGEKLIPPMQRELTFKLVQQNQSKTFSFRIVGPSYSKFAILPLNNHTLKSWSLTSGLPLTTSHWQDETVYMITYVRGMNDTEISWSFHVEFDVSNVKVQSYAFKMSWSAHYRLDNSATSFLPSFTNLLGKFPPWTRVTPGIAEVEEYLF